MITENNKNRNLWIIGGGIALCLCLACFASIAIALGSGALGFVPGFSPTEEPSPIPVLPATATASPIPTVVVISTETPAQSLSSSTGITNLRTSSDEDGLQLLSVFGIFDTVYVVGDVEDVPLGDTVTSRWYAEDVVDVEPDFFIDEADIIVDEDNFTGVIYFFFEPPTDGWPTGLYRVEVFYNGEFNGSVKFTVQ